MWNTVLLFVDPNPNPNLDLHLETVSGEAPVLENWVNEDYPLIVIIYDQHWPAVVVPVSVQSIVQIDF